MPRPTLNRLRFICLVNLTSVWICTLLVNVLTLQILFIIFGALQFILLFREIVRSSTCATLYEFRLNLLQRRRADREELH